MEAVTPGVDGAVSNENEMVCDQVAMRAVKVRKLMRDIRPLQKPAVTILRTDARGGLYILLLAPTGRTLLLVAAVLLVTGLHERVSFAVSS